MTYHDFHAGYEALRHATDGFKAINVDCCWAAARANATAIVVIRAILGVSGPEWQDLAKEETGAVFPNNWARGLDKSVRSNPAYFSSKGGRSSLTVERTTALFQAACSVLEEGAVDTSDGLIHRLDKIDTRDGLEDMRQLILLTRGKVFTANTLADLIKYTNISEFVPSPP